MTTETVTSRPFYTIDEVLALTNKRAKSTIYQAIAELNFPRPVQLFGRGSVWRKQEVDMWIVNRLAAAA